MCIYIYILTSLCGCQWISWHQRLLYQFSCVCNHSYYIMRVLSYLCLQLLSNLALSSSAVSLTSISKMLTWLSSPSRLPLVCLNPRAGSCFRENIVFYISVYSSVYYFTPTIQQIYSIPIVLRNTKLQLRQYERYERCCVQQLILLHFNNFGKEN